MKSARGYLTLAFLVGAVASGQAAGLEKSPEHTCRIAGTPRVAEIALKKVASGFTRPVAVLFSPTDKTESFVVEQGGLIKRVKSGVMQQAPVIDLRSVVNTSGNETGLLGMAFHPGYKNNKRVFLNYTTATRHRTVVSEFKMTAAGTLDRASEKVIIEIPQPYSNHNGGDIKFGPDGFLYIGTGDGGSANDPQGHGQNLSSLLGKMLRIDVDKGNPYAIPADNPRFQAANAKREIYAYGLRNPWRYSFDRVTGKLWAGDVGQNALEEIDIIEKGANLGWNTMEGTQCFRAPTCNRAGLTLPVHEYPRSDGVSVTGGYVYRGSALPSLVGRYLFADYGTGNIWGLKWDGSRAENKLLLKTTYNVSSFGEDLDGEVYVVDHRGGDIYKIEKGTVTAGEFPQKLSETGCFVTVDPLRAADGVIPYEVVSELWSDGAVKSRFVAVPDSTRIVSDAAGKLQFPEDSILIKNFYIPVRAGGVIANRITETRFLVKKADGFHGYTYRWNETLSDADYIGDALFVPVTVATGGGSVDFNYYIPGSSDCSRCHPGAGAGAAGFTVAHLNHNVPSDRGEENQLLLLARENILDIAQLPGDLGQMAALVDPYDDRLDLDLRARSWLHTNCSTCHNPVSGTATGDMDFRATTSLSAMKLCYVLPQHGDLGVTDARLVIPGQAEKSLAWIRTHSETPGQRMPPVASSRRDEQGSALIKTWINSLSANDCRVL